MVTRLVLVRHAKAQDPETGLSDAERQLAMAGLCSIEARYPVTFQLLPESVEGVQAWSSPARRALQTAEVIAKTIGLDGVEVKDSLYSEGVDAFLAQIAMEQGTIIAVGHNPFMEELYGHLSGNAQDMKPGAVASFAILDAEEGESPLPAKLEWFVQGPRVGLWQTIVDLEEGMAVAATRIDRCNAALLDNMDDQESLHQYRVSLEIAHALLGFVKPYCKRKQVKRVVRNIEGLLRDTRRLRDFDVLLESVDSSAPEAMSLREACMVEREEFHAKFRDVPTQRIIERITRQLRSVPWRSSVLEAGIDERALAQRLSDMQVDFELHLSQVPYDVQRAVYNVRKQARALQYVTREFLMCLPDDAAAIGMRAEVIQGRLGELCDYWNNARFIVAICGPSVINTAARFVVQADAIVDDLKTGRTHGLSISDS